MVPEKRLRQLAELGVMLSGLAADRDALFLEAVRQSREMTGAAYSSVGLVEEEMIHWLSGDGKPIEEVRGRRQPISEGLCGWVVRRGRPRRTGNVSGEVDYFEQYAEMLSELDVPIKVGEQTIGVLSVESPAPRAFTIEHEYLLQIVAQFMALAIGASDT